jgi:hypothetical protein
VPPGHITQDREAQHFLFQCKDVGDINVSVKYFVTIFRAKYFFFAFLNYYFDKIFL